MDMLYKLERQGFYMVNPPTAIEHCVDKYDILAILEDVGVPVPRTLATESVNEAIKAFNELGGDIVVKPVFGSRGQGATRVNDVDIADTIFKAITFHHGVIYMQEFVPHGHSDIRAFVIGDRVVSSMRRVAEGWKTNYSQRSQTCASRNQQRIRRLSHKISQSCRLQNRRRRHLGGTRRTTHRRCEQPARMERTTGRRQSQHRRRNSKLRPHRTQKVNSGSNNLSN